jgi:putative ABC transport system permease protein
VDRAIYVSQEGYEAMHEGFGGHENIDPLADVDHAEEKSVSVVLVGLKSRAAVLGLQRSFGEYRAEPLTAVMPGDTLLELWQLTGIAETALVWISGVVVVIGLVGITTNLLASVNERRREMAVLRAVGAGLPQVAGLILGEALLLTAMGVGLGLALFQVALICLAPVLQSRYGFELAAGGILPGEWSRMGWILLAGGLVGAIPAYRTYRRSLSDGISIRV